ncbi:hypothetical protein GCM10023238_29500 [Streptomyces heliomycini]
MVVNKVDRVTDAARVLALVRSLVDRAAVVPATYGRVDRVPLRLQAERGARRAVVVRRSASRRPRRAPSARRVRQRLLRVRAPAGPAAADPFLDSRPEGLYRIKGYVDFGPYDLGNRYAVHAVGRFLRFYLPRALVRREERLTQLVLIGSGIDPAALRGELEACGNDGAPHTDDHGMWGVLRYVQWAAVGSVRLDRPATTDTVFGRDTPEPSRRGCGPPESTAVPFFC